MSIGRTIARNTAFNAAGRAWEAIVGLVLVAYIVWRIGLDGYGLWAVVAAFTGYAALFDLGVGSAYTKYIAEHAARNERDEISRVVSTGFFFYLMFTALFIAVTWPAVDALIALIAKLNPERAGDLGRAEVLDDLRFLIRWGLVLFAASNCIAPFTAIQTGLQRMGITNLIGFGVSFVKIACTVYFLEAGHGVRGLLYTNAIVLGVFALASLAAGFYLLPSLRISITRINRPTFSKLYQFGWRSQVSRLSNLIMFNTDVLVIAIVLRDFQLAGLYTIGVELANKVRQVPTILLTALVPAASELDALDEQEKLRRLYLRSSKYVAAVTIPLLAFAAGAAALLIKGWQGTAQDLAVSVVVLRIMAAGYLANIVPGAGVTVALGKGRPDIQMKAGLISMTSNIVLTVALVYWIGFWGIPIATAVSMILSWAWFARAMGTLVDAGPRRLFDVALRWPLLAVAPGLALCAAADWAGMGLQGRPANLAVAAVAGGVLLATYLALLRRTPFIDSTDLDFFDEVLRLDRAPGYRWWTRAIRER